MVVVFSTGSRVIERRIEDDAIVLLMTVYPIYPWGNNVRTYVVLTSDYIKVYRIRDNWNGTGRDDLGYVYLTEDEYKDLYEKMMNVENPEDFEEVVKTFRRMQKKREENFDRAVDKLVEEFLTLELYDRALRYAEDDEIMEKLREEVREIINEYIENETVNEMLNKIKSRIEEFLTT